MATLTFYRVETDEGRGPYYGGDVYDIQGEHPVDWYSHPGPKSDPFLAPQWDALLNRTGYHTPDWLFGFTNLDALKAWFYGDAARAALGAKGYAVSAFTVDEAHVLQGSKQAVMFRPRATLVDRLSLSAV